MPDSPPYPDSGDASGGGPEPDSTTGTPRWVKVSAILAVVLVALVVAVLIFGGPGGHGPARH